MAALHDGGASMLRSGASWIRSRTLFRLGSLQRHSNSLQHARGWDWIALLYFVCCGVGRLAGFNVKAESLSESFCPGLSFPQSIMEFSADLTLGNRKVSVVGGGLYSSLNGLLR
jgi:hypothetical protein